MAYTYMIRRARQGILETLVVYGAFAFLAMLQRMCDGDSNKENNKGRN